MVKIVDAKVSGPLAPDLQCNAELFWFYGPPSSVLTFFRLCFNITALVDRQWLHGSTGLLTFLDPCKMSSLI
jgi:hypothetical protein